MKLTWIILISLVLSLSVPVPLLIPAVYSATEGLTNASEPPGMSDMDGMEVRNGSDVHMDRADQYQVSDSYNRRIWGLWGILGLLGALGLLGRITHRRT